MCPACCLLYQPGWPNQHGLTCAQAPHAAAAGALQEGAAYYGRAIEHCPTYAPAYYNMGVLSSETQQVCDAARSERPPAPTVLACHPLSCCGHASKPAQPP